MHNQWLQCHQSSSCIRDIYPLNSQRKGTHRQQLDRWKATEFRQSFFSVQWFCTSERSHSWTKVQVFLFLFVAVYFLVSSLIRLNHCVYATFFCGCSWHNSNTSTAETLCLQYPLPESPCYCSQKLLTVFHLPVWFFWLKDEETLEETKLSSPTCDPQTLRKACCRLQTPGTEQNSHFNKGASSWTSST